MGLDYEDGGGLSDDCRQLCRGVVYIDSPLDVMGVTPPWDASEDDGGRECWKDQRCGSGSPKVVVVVEVMRECSLGGSLKWLMVVAGEKADTVVGVCVGSGFSGRR